MPWNLCCAQIRILRIPFSALQIPEIIMQSDTAPMKDIRAAIRSEMNMDQWREMQRVEYIQVTYDYSDEIYAVDLRSF